MHAPEQRLQQRLTTFLSSRYAIWLAFPVGALVSLAFAPFNFWPLAIVSMAYLFAVWNQSTPHRAAKVGFILTCGTIHAGT